MYLGFTLGSRSDQSTGGSRTNNSKSGVGVNAAAMRVNMSSVASDPLFELVWCPNKGLGLKCADYRLNKNSSPLLCDAEQSNPISESKLFGTEENFEGYIEASRDCKLPKSTDQENQRMADKSNSPPLLIGHSKLAQDCDKSENKMVTHGSPITILQEKLDSASENNCKEKEQTLFHRETNGKTSKYDDDDDEDDSREIMESCSSVGLSSKGNKRRRFEENSMVGSKRIKQVQETPFLNWIANMVKALRQPNHSMGPTNPSLDYYEKIITSNQTHKPESGRTGFQSTNVHEKSTFNEEKTCGDIIIYNTKNPQIGTGCTLEATKTKVMFDAISKLRLSRSDIIRWKNSHIPMSNLDGFYVRLRLGKSKGLAGTRYYVASINGNQKEKSSKISKNPISVSVAGINCVVESQYVSNHDFLEDELMAWWEITSKSGKVPAEGDLKSKFGEREKLGF